MKYNTNELINKTLTDHQGSPLNFLSFNTNTIVNFFYFGHTT